MGRQKYTQRKLAGELGLSEAAVSVLRQRGMPTNSLAAAQAWRREHLNPAFTKRPPERPMRDTSAPGAPEWAPDRDIARGLLATTRFAIARAETDFALWGEPLRELLQNLPRGVWRQVEMSPELWDKLIGADMLALLGEPDRDAGAAMTSAEADEVGDVLYRLAAGLLVRAADAA